MDVKLKSISLKNFKGIKEFAISDITGNVTVAGDNATGKSTIMDSFLWLFFGKNSHDQKDFEVKTLKPDGTPIHHLEHEVSACILIDGQERYFKRALKEKWVKKRGEEIPEMQGHETFFWINDIPYQAGEYKTQIDQIMPESVFKLVSSPTYFNSLPWKERRNILTSICGTIPEPEGYGFIKQKKAEISLDKYKAEISAKKKLLKDELLLVPARIDEVFKATPAPVDEVEINKIIAISQKGMSALDEALESASKRFDKLNQANLDKKKLAGEIQGKMQVIKSRIDNENAQSLLNVSNKASQNKDKASMAQKNIDVINQNIKNAKEKINTLEIGIVNLRKTWETENARELVINEGDLNCPACKRPLDNIDSLKEEMTASFNAKKSENLKIIKKEGLEKAAEQTKYKEFIEEYKKDLQSYTDQLNELKQVSDFANTTSVQLKAVAEDPQYISLQKELDAIIYEKVEAENTDSLKAERQTIQTQIDELKKQLTVNELAAKNKTRITELQSREKELSQAIADLERIEFQIEGYTRSFVTQVETKVNSMFTLCKFRMFEKLLNGGIEEACECLVNGVPYSSNLNSAAKMNAGIDIINVLSKFYKVSSPVWIDNREGVNELIPTESQVINLVVTKDKELTVTNNSKI